jgi:hypothetical protein
MQSRRTKAAVSRRANYVAERYRIRDEIDNLERDVGMRGEDGSIRYGYADREIRDAYFRIESIDTRKRLIELNVNAIKIENSMIDSDIEQASAQLIDAKRYGAISEEIVPPLLGLLAVWIGNQYDGIVGAIAGAVVGIFLGLSYLRSKAAERLFAINIAQTDLDDAKKEKSQNYPLPRRFTDEEAKTGLRDKSFDVEANRII